MVFWEAREATRVSKKGHTEEQILRALRGMGVRIDDSRKHGAARQIDDSGVRAYLRAHRPIRTDCDDGVAPKCQSLGHCPVGILRVDLAMKQDDRLAVRVAPAQSHAAWLRAAPARLGWL